MNFAAFLAAAGLMPGAVVADGRWHRCPTEDKPRKKNGSWKLAADGRVGFCQNHAVHPGPLMWRPEREEPPPAFDPAALRRSHAEAQQRVREAIRKARAFYGECRPLLGGHPYLESHGLGMEGCHGLKVDRKGWLVVPAMQGRDLMSVQRISPDGEKLFWKDAPMKAAGYAIERPGASLTVVCEGLATGLALFGASPLTRVLVQFSAGNLASAPVPKLGMVVVAADNDHETAERTGTNPGIEAARSAAEAFGCGVAIPELMKGNDWADWRNERIADATACRLRHQTPSSIRRTVDAEVADALMRNARFRSPAGG